MTRIGKKLIVVPAGVEVKTFPSSVSFTQEKDQIKVNSADPEVKKVRAIWGLSWVLLANMIEGVTKGFSKQLEINGIGYRAAMAGKKLTLNVGFGHPVEYQSPEGIEIKVEKNIITVTGINKQSVGQVAAEIRNIKKPEPYKGKGIKYLDEIVRRKAGKVVKTTSG